MNKVGDYYYPVYTLSESSSISSFTSSNGVAPAAITDGTTLTFSHRGTVTLTSGETFEGKKYAEYIYDLTSPKGDRLSSQRMDYIWGFSNTTYYRWQWSSLAKGSTNTSLYEGLSIYNSGSSTLYLVYYANNTSHTICYGLQLSGSTATFTVTGGATIAKLDYCYNSAGPKQPESDLTTSDFSQVAWATGTNPSFNLFPRDNYYLYKSLTTYTEIEETLSGITVTQTGFAETGSFYYPEYTITATHDEDGEIEPSLTADVNYNVSGNVLSYSARTDAASNVSISYGGVNTTVEVPASIKYRKTTYDFGSMTKDVDFTASKTETNASTNYLGGFTATGLTRYTLSSLTGFSLGSSNYGWYIIVGKALQVGNAGNATSTLTLNDVTENSYAILYHNIGSASNATVWDDKNIEAEDIVSESDGKIALTIKDKNSSYYAYTKLEVFTPLYATTTATRGDMVGMNKTGNYYYPTYSINAIVEGEAAAITDLAVKDGGNATVNVGKGTVTYTGMESVTITVTTASGGDYDLELAAPVQYVKTHAYDFTTARTGGSSNTMNGFTGSFNRVQVDKDYTGFDFLTFSHSSGSQYNYFFPGYGVNFLLDGTIVAKETVEGQLAELVYIQGESGNTATYDVANAQSQFSSNNSLSFKSRDENVVYLKVNIYVPTTETKSVSVYAAVGGMSTLVSSYPMDFSGEEMKAYTASVDGSTVTFTRIKKVPAYTPILVKYKDTETATPSINFCNAENADAVSTNALKAGTGAAVATYPDETHTNFVLTTGNSGASHGFYFANGRTVATNRAYLQADTKIEAAGARLSVMFSDEETTGIKAVNREQLTSNGAVYNLQGQCVSNPTKGLFIVNGKKMFVK